jgi:hypothetical protein
MLGWGQSLINNRGKRAISNPCLNNYRINLIPLFKIKHSDPIDRQRLTVPWLALLDF